MKIAPSILACDFANMGQEIKNITNAGADIIHIDIMDGNFVPNISFGPSITKSIRKYTNLPFDVHLMIQEPHKYVRQFVDAGADIITFHVEADTNVLETIELIKGYGVKVGLSIKPKTKVDEIFNYLDKIYMVLIMSVEPGFGGQPFMTDMMDKVREIKKYAKNLNNNLLIEVDGGINEETIKYVKDAGADICVAGTSIFSSNNYREAISKLRI